MGKKTFFKLVAEVCLIVRFFLVPMDEYAWFRSQKNHIRLQKRFDCSSFFHFMPLSPRMMGPFTALRRGNNNNTILSLKQNCVRFVSLRVVATKRRIRGWMHREEEAPCYWEDREQLLRKLVVHDYLMRSLITPWMRGCWSMPGALGFVVEIVCFRNAARFVM